MNNPGKGGVFLLVEDVKECLKEGASGQSGSADVVRKELGWVG